MRRAQIDRGTVINVIVVDPENPPEWCRDWPSSPDAGPGWTFDGAAFHPPVEQPKA